MWKVNLPRHSAQNSFSTCISRVRDAELRARLQAVAGEIHNASYAFEAAACLTHVHTLRSAADVGGLVSREEMSKVYTQRMAKIGAPGREIYDELLSAPAHGRCPLCGHRRVSTLDHYLPKANFPALAVAPLNLIPACSDCNKAKGDFIPLTDEDEILHPYFDNLEEESWLRAAVVESVPAAVRFFVDPPMHWTATLRERVSRHFSIFGLAALYGSQAADELLNLRYYLRMIREVGGVDAVNSYLLERAESSAAVGQNSWRTATYRAFAASEWFCAGGFLADV